MRGAPRDITFATSIEGRLARQFVGMVENLTGRMRLVRRARGYETDLASGDCFWDVMARRYGLDPVFAGAGLGGIPAQGPVVVVANHPFGVLDGLMLGLILNRARGAQFRILANDVFARAPELSDIILPIDFSATPEAARKNIETRREAQRFLAAGGCIGIFPGGTVSTSPTPFGSAMDPAWRRFAAKLVVRSGASVVPVFFEGQNSRLFHLASHVSVPLRMGLMLREFRARADGPVRAVIGEGIGQEVLRQFSTDPKSMMDFLRERTYALSPVPVDWARTGREFDERHRM